MTTDLTEPNAQDDLSLQELELYHAIADYRASLDLPAIPLSRALTATAGRHVVDTRENIWAVDGADENASLHSWSDASYDAEDPDPQVMWEAPERLGTGYASPGYEISAAGYPTIEAALDAWIASDAHNAVLAQLGVWADRSFLAIGIGVDTSPGAGIYDGRIFHVWFGETTDLGIPDIRGETGDDAILGTAFADRIYALAGDDEVTGGAGDDVLYGGAGADTLSGDAGADRLSGGAGDDVLFGGRDDDRLSGGEGADTLAGDAGQDDLAGGADDDTLFGGAGDDTLDGDDGADRLSGGDGADRLSGGEGDDRLLGDAGDDWLSGGAGDDVLYGGEGDDRTVGDDGADAIWGDEGDDRLLGEDGDDRLSGDEGEDVLYGGAGDDRLFGGAGADYLFGKDGADSLFGGAGADRLSGDEGDDTLFGGAGDDALLGGEGDDILGGGGGVDMLTGGEGADTFVFAEPADAPLGSPWSTVVDFEQGLDSLDVSGIFAATTTPGEDDGIEAALLAFSFVGMTAFTGVAGELRQRNSLVEGDLDGDGAADFQFRVRSASLATPDADAAGYPALTEEDFIF